MSGYRTILALLDDGAGGAAALDLGLTVAKSFAAHVRVLHLGADASAIVPLVGEGMSAQVIEDLISSAEEDVAQRAKSAQVLFETGREKVGIPLVEAPEASGKASCSYSDLVGGELVTAQQGSLSDLIVMARPEAQEGLSGNLIFNAALMESGRPVLTTSALSVPSPGRNVAIAWNGSAEAARAVSAAMPFLAHAEKITVFGSGDLQGLVDYLMWHDVAADAQSLPGGADIGVALLNGAMDVKADLLVMGAYTHSRLRQLIFGGVTHHVLENATIPVLMMH